MAGIFLSVTRDDRDRSESVADGHDDERPGISRETLEVLEHATPATGRQSA